MLHVTPPSPESVSGVIRPHLYELLWAFTVIGMTSFGGGLSGRMMREFVHQRHWLDEEEFLNGLAISQALPGVNIGNLSIWIGYRLCGWRGAVAGFTGIFVPPAFCVVLLGVVFTALTSYPITHIALAGAAAAAIGLSLSMAVTSVIRLPRRVFPYALMVLTFVAVVVLHWPLIWTVLVGGAVGVAVEYRRAVALPAGDAK